MADASYQQLTNSAFCKTEPEEFGHHADSLWNEFFRDSSKWYDNRMGKQKRRQPDFIHKVTKEPLWMHSCNNPSWVRTELLRRGLFAEQNALNAVDAPSPSLLWACSKSRDLQRGTGIHDELQKGGLIDRNYSDPLITMYAKCGELAKAQDLLNAYGSSNVIPWTALIAGYAREGKGQEALACFRQMQSEGIHPNEVTYSCILKACAAIGALDEGTKIHYEISKKGLLEHHIVVGGALVDMYVKCGALDQAQYVLKELPFRNVVTWNILISGYAQKGHCQQALCCFEQMQNEGITPDEVTYACILKVCSLIKSIDLGKKIHQVISRQRLLEHHAMLANALVDMYAKCGDFLQARSVLEKLPYRNVISWNALITGFAQNGHGQQALDCLEQMQSEGISPNEVSYVSSLQACAALGAIDIGKKIHDEILRQGMLEHHIVLGGALVNMYARCGALVQARSVLDKLPVSNIFSWNALIMGYAQSGQGQEALDCFEELQHKKILPNEVTYICILKACAAIKAVDVGKNIHNEILRQGYLEHHIMLGNSLVDMYAKCGALHQAQCVLEELPFRNVVSWNTLIAGYVLNGQGQIALDCYRQMQHEGISQDEVTYGSVLKACAAVGTLNVGEKIHDEILRQGLLEHCTVLAAALVDMYAKCGDLCQAQSVLEKLPAHDIVSWNSLITAHAQNGQGQKAFDCFNQMQRCGVLPDEVTFCCLLNLCCHLGLVEKGQELIDSMEASYGLEPDAETFSNVVDLLGRSGHLAKVAEIIQQMPLSADSRIWHGLLDACIRWTDVSMGTWAFDQAVKLDKCDGAAYTLMMNLYAAAGMPEKAKDIETMRIRNKAWNQDVPCELPDVQSMKVANKVTQSLSILHLK